LVLGFVGAGKVGTALGLYFKQHEIQVAGYYSRSAASAQAAARLTGTGAFLCMETLAEQCDCMFLTTPDLELEEVDREAGRLITSGVILPGKRWIHVSGAFASDCLADIKAAGSPVGSMHPLHSFGDPVKSCERLKGTFFTLEGMPETVEAMRCLLERTDAKYSLLTSVQKPLYHAGACVFSNYLVTLMESGIRFMEAAGMRREDVLEAVEPMIQATISNVMEKGTVSALTGPIARGDYNTLDVHLRALEANLPSEREFYKFMARNTIRLVVQERLTQEQEKNLLKTLGDGYYGS